MTDYRRFLISGFVFLPSFWWMFFICILFHVQASARVTCVTSKCHTPTKEKPAVVHGPLKADGCHVCHQKGRGTLLKAEGKFPKGHPVLIPLKKSDINSACVLCHDDFPEALKLNPVHHKAISEKTCTGCHNPHSAPHPSLLSKSKKDPALCLSCHEKVKNAIEEAEFQHGALSEKVACLNCHAAHFSKENALLKDEPAKLCLDCHSKEIQKKDGKTVINIKAQLESGMVKHKPIKQGKCAGMCHAPHGASVQPLLSEAFSPRFYQKFEEGTFELCFQCHEAELASKPTVEDETKFRNGDKNLHYFHLNVSKKGYGCMACHDVHATSQARLIKSWIPFHGLEVPLKFTATPSGGNCATACHGTKKYDREEAVINEKGR